jgi:hypothetical protein
MVYVALKACLRKCIQPNHHKSYCNWWGIVFLLGDMTLDLPISI